MKKIYGAALVFAAVLMGAVSPVGAESGGYRDGVFEGEYSFVKVRVTVQGGKISDIEILQHGGGGEKYEEMIQPLLAAIIENQSTDVDGITGATVSSDNLKRAVENATQPQAGEQDSR